MDLARQLVESGAADCVLALGFEQMQPGALRSHWTDRPSPFDRFDELCDEINPYPDVPLALRYFGGAGKEYMDRYGTGPELFAQVLANLIKNALHALVSASTALCPGDLRLTVSVRHRRGRIVVADGGVGIPNELQSRIFEPFYSTQAGAGNGLGLSFCKNVVEDAHGKLTVHSQSGKGAVFTIELPLDRSETPFRPSAPLSPDPCH